MEHDSIRDGLTAMSAGASTLTEWALAILGTTVAAIIGSEYLRPTGKVRYTYLLFIPGWLLLGISIFYGERIMRRLAACAFAKTPDRLLPIGNEIDSDYIQQRWFFQFALLTFGCWLVSLLIWWVFIQDRPAGKKEL